MKSEHNTQTHKCYKEDKINLICADIQEMKSDIKDILKWKWQIIGGFGTILIIITVGVNLWNSLSN